MASSASSKQRFRHRNLWLIATLGAIVPRRLRADWQQEWKAVLRHRELLLADWDKLNWRTKLNLSALLLNAVALLACFLPARRATKVDPLAALLHE